MIAIDLSTQQVLKADSKAIQQINFIDNLDRAGNTRFYFIQAKETVFEFSQGTVKVLLNVILLNTKYILILINIKMT